MKYCYCSTCDRARPKTFFLSNKCEVCHEECVILDVRRSGYGYAMYLLDLLAAVLVVFYIAHNDLQFAPADWVGSINQEWLMGALFGLIIASFFLGMLDMGRTNARAMEQGRTRKRTVQ